jgi:hypothetical protein
MQEEHQWWDTDRNDGTHQREHPVTSAAYERPDLTTITLMFCAIAQENTLNRLCSQLSALTRCKKHIAHTSKKMKAGVIERLATKTLKRNTTMKGQKRLNINQISSSRNSLSPKVRWNRVGQTDEERLAEERAAKTVADCRRPTSRRRTSSL